MIDELSETCSFMTKQICEISASSWFYYTEKHMEFLQFVKIKKTKYKKKNMG